MSSPKVSVVMCAWNHENYLRQSAECILNQTLEDFELIIIADESPDDTIQVARGIESMDDRVTLLVNDKRLYNTKSLNRGIDESTGDFIAIADSDDLATPERLAKQVAYMEAHPNTILTAQHDFYAKQIDGDGNIIQEYYYPANYDYPPVSGVFESVAACIHSSFMFRNDGIRYREKFKDDQGTDLYCRCVTSGYDVHLMKDNLVARRIHQNQKQTRLEGEEHVFHDMAMEMMYNRMRGWDEGYDEWEPELPYTPKDRRPFIK